METRRLGINGPAVSAIGLGCMGMSEFYGVSDRRAALRTIASALDAGITLFDTGDFYGMGDNEMLLAEALRGRREQAFVQVKFGAQRDPGGAFLGIDASPSAVKTALAYSLRRLATDHVDLYQTGLDPSVPVEDTIGAIADLVKTGYVRHVGITNVDAQTLRRAHAVHPITAIQVEYGLLSREVEDDVLPTCRELGIGITAYGVLGRGLLTRSVTGETGDVRPTYYPRFRTENRAHNDGLADALSDAARTHQMSAAQAAVAWVASRGDAIVPLVGARTPERLAEALTAPLHSTPEILRAIEIAVPRDAARGSREMTVH